MSARQTKLQTDKEGYLKNLADWDTEAAQELAESESITLTTEHWELIQLIRAFYNTYKISPTMRVLVRQVGQQLGADKGRSIHLMKLFPVSPLKRLSKIAGLPKPPNCD